MEELAESKANVEGKVKDYLRLKAGLFHKSTMIQKKMMP